MAKILVQIGTAAFFAAGLAGCDVDKTQEGSVNLPKYNVEKTQEGSARMPEYDVKTPDVAVNSKEKKVEVPTVKKEERTVRVPDVDVTPADKK
ncbi:hypothetical protein [Noviherbaspirillum aridicola]|uniref:Lipoprotein n=1 Tax=Noviherbaspirillum aridicola TaxID=2849687 RepID=A0ABQ4QAJ6_9BURK|nr:hypothetical protein [Noviherbaspirillum aridicola]GIZ53704.1 hypothetical protein NCCP691_37180 [Noviherbaspirillum aridicola]